MADWQFGGNNIYQNMSAREKLIVLQRDQTFMKDTTTWQEEYQRQQLLATTEEDKKQETDPVKIWESIMDKDAGGFGDSSSSQYDRGLPLGINYGKGKFGGNAEGVQQLLMAMGRQNQTKFMNDQQKELFDNITKGTTMTKDSGFDKLGMYISGADGERYNLPQGETVTYQGREVPRSTFNRIQREISNRALAFGGYIDPTRQYEGMSLEYAKYAAGVGGAADFLLSGHSSGYNQNTGTSINRIVDGRVESTASASAQRSMAAAQQLGRMTWYRGQNKNYTISRGGSGHGIVNHYVRNAVSAEDKEAMASLANSHDTQVREFGQEAFDRGKDIDILWLRKQTENQAKALSASIGMRVAAERATALQFGNQLGISQNEALQILRDKSQGEQTLNDMLAYQQRLDAMSSGVV